MKTENTPKAIIVPDDKLADYAKKEIGITDVRPVWGTPYGGFTRNGSRGCFYSRDLTVSRKSGSKYSPGSSISAHSHKQGAIKGLKCPDCGAQAYYTDHPRVATCGAYAGWFFFFQENREEETPKYKLQIINGVVKQVPVETKDINTK